MTLAGKKQTVYVAVMVKFEKRFSLPFRAWRVAISEAGQAYVCEKGRRTVLALQMSGSGECEERWRHDLPSDYRDPWIAASSAATSPLCLLQNDGTSSPTVAMDGGKEVSRTEGQLLTCIGHRVVYRRRREDGRGWHEIVLWGDADANVTLRPPPGQEWSDHLSVCGSDTRVAVVDGGLTSTLHIFQQHQHQHQRKSHSQLRQILSLCDEMSQLLCKSFCKKHRWNIIIFSF
jgi:hypothetical protein